MPYIKWKRRMDILPGEMPHAETAGELNYIITWLVKDYLDDNPNYERFNSAVGVLESAKLELYRRKVAPYEDEKIKENGDVY
jgi:hypothetical protein